VLTRAPHSWVDPSERIVTMSDGGWQLRTRTDVSGGSRLAAQPARCQPPRTLCGPCSSPGTTACVGSKDSTNSPGLLPRAGPGGQASCGDQRRGRPVSTGSYSKRLPAAGIRRQRQSPCGAQSLRERATPNERLPGNFGTVRRLRGVMRPGLIERRFGPTSEWPKAGTNHSQKV
jgi:hypothetical protein